MRVPNGCLVGLALVVWCTAGCLEPPRPAFVSPLAKPLGSVMDVPAPSPALDRPWPPRPADGDWPCFGRTAARDQHSPLAFPSTDVQLLWTYTLSDHTYEYRSGTNLWSESLAVVARNGRTLVLVGAYDRKVHCIDGATGEQLWRFTTGDEVVATPALGTAVAAVASTDRAVYGLNFDGTRRWMDQTLAWSHTVAPAVAASPTIVTLDGRECLAGAYFVNDFGPSERRQDGVVALWDLATGRPRWRVVLRRDHVFGPAAGAVAGRPTLFYATGDGVACALDARSGTVAWTRVTDERIRACPTFFESRSGPTVLVCSRWGMLWALDGATGAPRWNYRAGHMADGSPAVWSGDGRRVVYYGTYDRCLHAVDGDDGSRLFAFRTGNVIVSSPAVARCDGKPVVFFSALDDMLYCLDGMTGAVRWSFRTGPLPWPYFKRGDAVFGSPVVCRIHDRTTLLHPAHDGRLYCFAAPERPRLSIEEEK